MEGSSAEQSFTPALFRFLRELKANNTREWFAANKDRYETEVRGPALDFVADVAPRLERISPHFVADPRPSGGSLFRIHRDTRFSKDRSPYKTYTGLQFRHELRRMPTHPVSTYTELEAVRRRWNRTDSTTLAEIREAIAATRRRGAKATGDHAELADAPARARAMTRHPLIEDLRQGSSVATPPSMTWQARVCRRVAE
jgi:uncharacterized protein (TIGR02453 family)